MHPLLLQTRQSRISQSSTAPPVFLLLLAILVLLFMAIPPALAQGELQTTPQIHTITVRLLDGSIVQCGPANDGTGYFELLNPDPSAASDLISQGWYEILLFSFGYLAQFIFMSRFLVQWLASEKEKKSVIPVTFWWLSLSGATMLLLYFILRHEPVGILGQSFGWMVYLRNLILIYRTPEIPAE